MTALFSRCGRHSRVCGIEQLCLRVFSLWRLVAECIAATWKASPVNPHIASCDINPDTESRLIRRLRDVHDIADMDLERFVVKLVVEDFEGRPAREAQ